MANTLSVIKQSFVNGIKSSFSNKQRWENFGTYLSFAKETLNSVLQEETQREIVRDGRGVGDHSFDWSQEFSYIAIESFWTPANSNGDRKKEELQLYA